MLDTEISPPPEVDGPPRKRMHKPTPEEQIVIDSVLPVVHQIAVKQETGIREQGEAALRVGYFLAQSTARMMIETLLPEHLRDSAFAQFLTYGLKKGGDPE
ncbi:Uncharacterised protein [Mycobacteroides abscessus subsp. massiliense]|uniref:hypothetical protein n=1 Tax=Mycobacteroides abscessus TaxID=36809 RepID=UPI0009A5BCAD|nr:hypothetical protein [Mycobacteroides abscessus]SKM82340.1 Uncharacterised protein [Mycobacteroides abscessus subsp. massiliense]SKM99038.1 Uncharacterised protein [Mycobacteroides abscessus subsp. massiliense]SKN77668.1 Uncharacterised protein [Mycobacteroides abscessus subsp. massiliense]SKN95571.1 Uncharacterised protein [Mycobacteroides abscessus subsp. massiliense]SKO22921.1 Uncharacterised protein [Mycobacteroides abscessus subsp. massiliense]